jgi:phosphoglycerol transferase
MSFGAILLLAIAAGAGVYYAFFGCLFIAAGGVMGWTGARRKEPLLLASAYITIIVAVIALSLLPNALYHLAEGTNPLVAHRQSSEAEIYGLRITQLLLPPEGHRLHWFADLTRKYDAAAPLLNENRTATLGTLGSLGLLVAIGFCLLGDRSRLPLVATLGALAICGILFATIGGFGALFSLLVTPDIRGLNRISVFIAFFAIATTLILAQRACGSRDIAHIAVAMAIVIIGWNDEVPPNKLVNYPDPAAFDSERNFFREIQNVIPRGSSIYELPYMFFPENPKTGSLFSYDLFQPYLHTDGLRWSFGDMHGRASDAWNAETSTLIGRDLVRALASAGFRAIYLNRAGYADRAAALEDTIRPLLGVPIMEDPSRGLALYKIPASATPGLPFVVVTPGRGWFSWETEAHRKPLGHSKGSADLLVANPGEASRVLVKFTLTSTTARHLTVRYGDELLGDYALKANVPREVQLNFEAAPRVSHLTLDTQPTSAQDPFAFRLDNLVYGAEGPE